MQYLYLIQCQQYFKIGVANDVESRLAQLSTGNPYTLKVLAVYGYDNAEFVERAVHQRFALKRTRGEWFELSSDEINIFRNVCESLGGFVPDSLATGASEYEIEEAENLDVSLENVRTELRMLNGEPRGVVLVSRDSDRNVIYVGKRDRDFEKYLELYKQQHPNSRVLK